MLAVGIGRVVATKSEKHKKDDLLLGYGIPWAEYAFVNPMGLETLIPNHPLYYYLGLLGIIIINFIIIVSLSYVICF